MGLKGPSNQNSQSMTAEVPASLMSEMKGAGFTKAWTSPGGCREFERYPGGFGSDGQDRVERITVGAAGELVADSRHLKHDGGLPYYNATSPKLKTVAEVETWFGRDRALASGRGEAVVHTAASAAQDRPVALEASQPAVDLALIRPDLPGAAKPDATGAAAVKNYGMAARDLEGLKKALLARPAYLSGEEDLDSPEGIIQAAQLVLDRSQEDVQGYLDSIRDLAGAQSGLAFVAVKNALETRDRIIEVHGSTIAAMQGREQEHRSIVEELHGEKVALQELNKRLLESLKSTSKYLEIAFGAEGDTFGIDHNGATDALGEAEALITEVEG